MNVARLIEYANTLSPIPKVIINNKIEKKKVFVTKQEVSSTSGKEHGRLGNLRGKINEQRVLEALQRIGLPSWACWIRLATKAEDAKGIDIVLGRKIAKPIYLQVKSRNREASYFRAKNYKLNGILTIPVIVVKDNMNDEEVYKKAMEAFEKLGIR